MCKVNLSEEACIKDKWINRLVLIFDSAMGLELDMCDICGHPFSLLSWTQLPMVFLDAKIIKYSSNMATSKVSHKQESLSYKNT